MRGQLHRNHIFRLEKHIDHFRRQRHILLTQAIQQRFQNMRHFSHVVKTERARTAFYGVGSTKDGVEIVHIWMRNIQCQQQLFHPRQMFGCFLKENLIKLA